MVNLACFEFTAVGRWDSLYYSGFLAVCGGYRYGEIFVYCKIKWCRYYIDVETVLLPSTVRFAVDETYWAEDGEIVPDFGAI